jgi:hypothetical protein
MSSLYHASQRRYLAAVTCCTPLHHRLDIRLAVRARWVQVCELLRQRVTRCATGDDVRRAHSFHNRTIRQIEPEPGHRELLAVPGR